MFMMNDTLFIPACLLLSEQTIGYDALWILGDNFVAKTFKNNYKKFTPRHPEEHYIKENFEYLPHCNSRYASSQSNILARIQNTFASAISSTKKSGLLLRYILVILDDD